MKKICLMCKKEIKKSEKVAMVSYLGAVDSVYHADCANKMMMAIVRMYRKNKKGETKWKTMLGAVGVE